MNLHRPAVALYPLSMLVLLSGFAFAQAGQVLSEQKISAASVFSSADSGFAGALDAGDRFGSSVTTLGDLDGDGIDDLAVGAADDDDGGWEAGAVWILFRRANGSVRAFHKISALSDGFGGKLEQGDYFGISVDNLGDLDGDGVVDLAVGAWGDDDGGASRGALWILFLRADGTVKTAQKISQTDGGFGGSLDLADGLGYALTRLGDLDGDGVVDLAVGAIHDDDGGMDRGAVWILFLNSNGTVKAQRKISQTTGGFGGVLSDTDTFGAAVAGIGDLDGDGVLDLAVGAHHDDDGGIERGAVWILFLNPDGTVKDEQKISSTRGGFRGALSNFDYFGFGITSVRDLDGDGRDELVAGAIGDPGGKTQRGAFWILFLNANGTVRARQLVNEQSGGFHGSLDPNDWFGIALADLGDLNGDGFPDLAVGAIGDDDGGGDCGALWILNLQGCPGASAVARNPSVGGTANPSVYTVSGPPRMGAVFTASVATGSHAGCILAAYADPLTLTTMWGNLLVDPSHPDGEILGLPFSSGDPAQFAIPIPDDPAMCGIQLSTQAVRVGGGIDLTNAQDLLIGR